MKTSLVRLLILALVVAAIPLALFADKGAAYVTSDTSCSGNLEDNQIAQSEAINVYLKPNTADLTYTIYDKGKVVTSGTLFWVADCPEDLSLWSTGLSGVSLPELGSYTLKVTYPDGSTFSNDSFRTVP